MPAGLADRVRNVMQQDQAPEPAPQTESPPKSLVEDRGNREPFYMVQGSRSGVAKKHHPTFEVARAEAERLAGLNPGRHYWIMRSVATVVVRRPEDSKEESHAAAASS
jgi:hypothetical protein